MAIVVKQFRFEAAHFLPNHDGQCRELHGHSYLLEVGVPGYIKNEVGHAKQGMVADFQELSCYVKPIVAYLDHTLLNEQLGATTDVPMAEVLGCYIYGTLHMQLAGKRPTWRPLWVRLWETSTSYAEVNYADWESLSGPYFRTLIVPQ